MRYVSVFLMLMVVIDALAQQVERVTIHMDSVEAATLFAEIEKQTKYTFYYNEDWIDTLRITVKKENALVTEVLQEAFLGTFLTFSVLKSAIFITQGRQLITELPEDYFNEERTTPTTITQADYSEYERKEKALKEAEEKINSIGVRTENLEGVATITGIISDASTGESVVGASVFIEKPMVGTGTDQFGYYSLTIPKGRHSLKIQSIGMKAATRQVMVFGDGKLNIELTEEITPLKEVVVESERGVRMNSTQMGVEKLDMKTMKQMPLVLGETDIMKVVLTLPGVQTVGEGTVGLNVRGGATNQNLILYNDAMVYNPSHLFGFFSTFNPDVLKNVELYKSGITADYGGRLSSVLDVRSREGSSKKIQGSGGISPITARFMLEGPIIKDRTTFLVGVRSTYSDWILSQVDAKELKNSSASFYDVNTGINHKIDQDNSLYISAYLSADQFKLNTDTAYQYSDRNASIKWQHIFNSKLSGVFTGSMNRYQYAITSDANPVTASSLDFSINQWNAKADFNYFPDAKHNLTGGISVLRYLIAPGNFQPVGEQSEIIPVMLQNEQALESALYVGENFDITPALAVYAGLRYSFYQSMGPREVFTYADGVPRQKSSIQDTLYYGSGKPIAKYHGPEPRFSVRYTLSSNTSVKISYNRMIQYIQMLSNTTAIAPTDIWKLSDGYIRPQIGNQVSIGYYKNLKGSTIEASIEAYYKTTEQVAEFKDGADLLLNPQLETEIIEAQGKAYGVELLLKKSAGKLNGWVNYTYSRSLLKTVGQFPTETVNGGVYYPSSYDKPHAVNFVGNYKVTRRFNFSLNVTYSTGRPITLPIAKYEIGGVQRVYYSDRNEFRIPNYFRMDASINVEGNHKIKKLAHSSWTFSVYNLTSRDNAYSVFFTAENGTIKGYQLSVFAKAIPTITYNFKF